MLQRSHKKAQARRSGEFNSSASQRGFTISAAQQWCSHAAAKLRRPGFAGARMRSLGFTIIEVLIVLAIAGLIMVVVFLAVPALQRSGRNNSLTADARTILAAASTYVSDNRGTLPASLNGAATQVPSSGVVTIGASGTNQQVVKVSANVVLVMLNGTTLTSSDTVGTVQIVTGTTAVCNSTANGLSGGGSLRATAVLFVAEGASGNNVLRCISGYGRPA